MRFEPSEPEAPPRRVAVKRALGGIKGSIELRRGCGKGCKRRGPRSSEARCELLPRGRKVRCGAQRRGPAHRLAQRCSQRPRSSFQERRSCEALSAGGARRALQRRGGRGEVESKSTHNPPPDPDTHVPARHAIPHAPLQCLPLQLQRPCLVREPLRGAPTQARRPTGHACLREQGAPQRVARTARCCCHCWWRRSRASCSRPLAGAQAARCPQLPATLLPAAATPRAAARTWAAGRRLCARALPAPQTRPRAP